MSKMILVYLLLFGVVAFGQDLKTDLTTCYKTFGNNSLALDFTVSNYDWSGKKTVQNGKIRKESTSYYSSLGQQSFLINKKLYLSIDDNAKQLTYKNMGNELPKTNVFDEDLLEQQLKIADTVLYKGKTSGLKRYELLFSGGPIVKAEIYLDQKAIRKLIYHYPKPNAEEEYEYKRTIIEYTKIETNVIGSSFFNYGKYVTKSGNKYACAKNYLGYELHELR